MMTFYINSVVHFSYIVHEINSINISYRSELVNIFNYFFIISINMYNSAFMYILYIIYLQVQNQMI